MEHQDHQEHKDHQERARQDGIARVVVDAGLKVHKTLGPGLLESAYESCLAHELGQRGLAISRQEKLPIIYEGIVLESGYRLDLVVANTVIVEIKTIETITRLHEAQLLTYLRFSPYRIGLLMNFNVALFKQGVRRLVY